MKNKDYVVPKMEIITLNNQDTVLTLSLGALNHTQYDDVDPFTDEQY